MEGGSRERGKRKGTGFRSRPESLFVKLIDFFYFLISTYLSFLTCKLGRIHCHAPVISGKHSGYILWNHQYFLSACDVLHSVLGAFMDSFKVAL